jgi:hypothetical protein
MSQQKQVLHWGSSIWNRCIKSPVKTALMPFDDKLTDHMVGRMARRRLLFDRYAGITS